MQKVLVIDDDELVLKTMENALEEEYEVLVTADGPQGITIYKQQRPDLVLLDLGLPSMSGIEVLRELRSFDPRARVIIVSGYGASESVTSAIRYGAWDFIEKTVGLEELLKKIHAALQVVP